MTTLTARHNPHAPEVIEVMDERGTNGGIVYRLNTKHDIGTRTNHEGPRPSLKAIRVAIAAL